MTTYESLLRSLYHSRVAYAVIGGMAAISYGASTPTFDLDLCYETSPGNVERLFAALEPFHPIGRDPDRTPLDERWLLSGVFANLTTTAGALDLLPTVAGVGSFAQLLERCETLEIFGVPVHVIGLDDLIVAKQAVGRPKDIAVVHELVERTSGRSADAAAGDRQVGEPLVQLDIDSGTQARRRPSRYESTGGMKSATRSETLGSMTGVSEPSRPQRVQVP